ncbi:hypothetical protein Tco_1307099, partial [Tanacetum coccineum]
IDDDLHDLSSVEAEFPAIVINDAFAPHDALQCKSQVKNDNEKAIPSIPSPEPAISCFDDLDFLKDFENEFLVIVYNDAQTSKSDLLTEPTLNPQHIDELTLNDETSLSEYDEEEQNVLYFNNLFSFNVIHPNDLKSDEDNDNNEIDITRSSEGNEIIHGSCVLFETSHDKITKSLRTGSFVINLKVKIVIWKYYWKRIFKKRTKTKPKRQNRARECEEREKSKVKPEAKTEEILNGPGQPIKGFIEDQMGPKGPKPF